MKVFNFDEIKPEEKQTVFYQTDNFKTRIIELNAGDRIPDCDMSAYVMFTVLSGEVEINVNEDTVNLSAGKCLITEPATLSMTSKKGVRILGIQIEDR